GAGAIGSFTPSAVDNTSATQPFSSTPNTPLTFTAGQTTVSIPLYKDETASLVASDGSISSSGLSVAVAPAGLNRFLVEKNGGGALGTPTAGTSVPGHL